MPNNFPITRVAWFILVVIVSVNAPLASGSEITDTTAKNKTNLQSTPAYSVHIGQSIISGRVGKPVQILLDLSPYPPPAGLFYSIVADVLQKPKDKAPKVLPGDHDITVWCPAPGTYRLRIRVNLITKSSCGGAQADNIDEKEIRLVITE